MKHGVIWLHRNQPAYRPGTYTRCGAGARDGKILIRRVSRRGEKPQEGRDLRAQQARRKHRQSRMPSERTYWLKFFSSALLKSVPNNKIRL